MGVATVRDGGVAGQGEREKTGWERLWWQGVERFPVVCIDRVCGRRQNWEVSENDVCAYT